MPITNINQIDPTMTFQQWWETTNSVIDELSSVVTIDDTNTGNIIATGSITAGATGIVTNVMTPISATDNLELNYNTVEFKQQQIIYVANSGLSNAIQFIKGTDADAAGADTWAMGPVESHDDFQITGKNKTTGNDSTLVIERSDASTKGKLTGTFITIDDAILPDSISSTCDRSNGFSNSIDIVFGGDASGTLTFDGTDPEIDFDLTVDFSSAQGVDSLTIGDGLAGLSGVTAVTTFNADTSTGTISHGATSSVVDTDETGTYAVQSLGFDDFGHVTSATQTNFASTFLKLNTDSTSDRGVLQGFGFTVENGTKVSFGDAGTANESHIVRDVNFNGFSTLTINSGKYQASTSPGQGQAAAKGRIVLQAHDEIRFQDYDGTTTKFKFDTGNGNLSASGDITAFASFSDISLKENIEPIENALDKVCSLGGYTFNYIDAPEKGRVPGVIAQEVQKVLPEAVYETQQGTLAVRYDNTIALLLEAIKELKQQVDELKGE